MTSRGARDVSGVETNVTRMLNIAAVDCLKCDLCIIEVNPSRSWSLAKLEIDSRHLISRARTVSPVVKRRELCYDNASLHPGGFSRQLLTRRLRCDRPAGRVRYSAGGTQEGASLFLVIHQHSLCLFPLSPGSFDIRLSPTRSSTTSGCASWLRPFLPPGPPRDSSCSTSSGFLSLWGLYSFLLHMCIIRCINIFEYANLTAIAKFINVQIDIPNKHNVSWRH